VQNNNHQYSGYKFGSYGVVLSTDRQASSSPCVGQSGTDQGRC